MVGECMDGWCVVFILFYVDRSGLTTTNKETQQDTHARRRHPITPNQPRTTEAATDTAMTRQTRQNAPFSRFLTLREESVMRILWICWSPPASPSSALGLITSAMVVLRGREERRKKNERRRGRRRLRTRRCFGWVGKERMVGLVGRREWAGGLVVGGSREGAAAGGGGGLR